MKNILILIMFLYSITSFSKNQCADLFAQFPIANEETGILRNIDLLVTEKLKLDTGLYTNENQKKMATEYFVKNLNSIIQIDSKFLSIFKKKLTEKSVRYGQKTKLNETEKKESDQIRNQIIQDSMDPFNLAKQKMIFHQILPGKFIMDRHIPKVKIENKNLFQSIVGSFKNLLSAQVKKNEPAPIETNISEPFYLMSTPFTQMMWARLQIAMGEAQIKKISPSNNKSGVDSLKLKFNNIEITLNPDHPVENVSQANITAFLEKLNLLSVSNEPAIQNLLIKIIPDHRHGDIYDLPTEVQWEFVMRNRRNEVTEVSAHQYGWLKENSNGKTHAVAQLLPLTIEGQPFYDMIGNVVHWNRDYYNFDLRNKPDLSSKERAYIDSRRGTHGSSFHDKASAELDIQTASALYDKYDYVGFRLVKTRP